jgi:NAD(P)H-dependent FMN reductase
VAHRILVFYGSYRVDRKGIGLARFIVSRLQERGDLVEFIDAQAVALPMLDRMYKEFPKGGAPPAMEALAGKLRTADAFIFIVGEYNWGFQPGLKNLTDHFLEEWFWRPAAIASYSAGRFAGARSALLWHGTLSEMGMVVISSALAVGPIGTTLTTTANRSARREAPLRRHFHALPTISLGGPRPRKLSARNRRLPTSRTVRPDGVLP